MAITINPELQSLIPPLTAEEYDQLETNIQTDGCRDPLTVWAETQTLLDGHNRMQICERHQLRYPLHEISLPDLDAAKIWIITNQLGRRNLSPDQMSLYRGEQYNLLKKQGKRTDLTSPQSEEKSQGTSHALAVQHHVSHATIERDGAYAEAVEALVAVLGPAVRQQILGGDLKLPRQALRALGGLVARNAETADAVREVFQHPDPGPRLQAIASAQRCGICERPLSDPASIERGIGPICAGHGNGKGEAAAPVPLSSAPGPEPAVTDRPVLSLEGHLEQAAAAMAVLAVRLKKEDLPSALDPHPGLSGWLAKACQQVMDMLATHPVVREALSPTPAPQLDLTAAPVSPPPEDEPVITRQTAGGLTPAVWFVVQKLQPCSNAEIAKVLGEPRNRTHQALGGLVKQGKVRKEGEQYRVVDAEGATP
jgi:Family of unknown function (DUF6011)